MTLSELKEPFENNYKINKTKLDKYSCNEIAELYLSSSSLEDKNAYTSFLLCNAWNLLQRIYYVGNNAKLSCEECYDIFIQTFQYVIENHVWDNPNSTLYKDENAFMKAMAVTIQCRKKNYIESKFKQKRIINNNIISLDSLYDDYVDGYFTQTEEPEYNISDYILEEKIHYYFINKCYLTAFILDGILYNNVYDEHNNLDLRKLRKYLRNINDDFCKYFSYKYNLVFDEVKNSLVTFDSDNQALFDKKINTSFITLRNDDTIKQILDI